MNQIIKSSLPSDWNRQIIDGNGDDVSQGLHKEIARIRKQASGRIQKGDIQKPMVLRGNQI